MENYTTLAKKEVVEQTIKNLASNGIEGMFVAKGVEALAKIKELIPAGVSVMNGSSVTLETIGFVDYLKAGQHGWNNLHDGILAEKDPVKQAALRKQAVLSDYYLGSVHALSQTGEFIVASNSGSQLPHIVFTSPNLIFVVGAQKLVPNLEEGLKRLQEHVIPLEDVHMMQKFNVHTYPSKVVMFKKEQPFLGRKVKMIIVNEVLGF
ncbi:MAG: lactate utilization protein [Candidatus Paceibacterales bacterium]